MVDTHMPFRLFLAYQDAAGVWDERAMDKCQAHVVWEYGDLTDACADRPAAFLVIIAESPAVLDLGGSGSDAGDDIADLEHDVAQIGVDKFKVFLDVAFGKHSLIAII